MLSKHTLLACATMALLALQGCTTTQAQGLSSMLGLPYSPQVLRDKVAQPVRYETEVGLQAAYETIMQGAQSCHASSPVGGVGSTGPIRAPGSSTTTTTAFTTTQEHSVVGDLGPAGALVYLEHIGRGPMVAPAVTVNYVIDMKKVSDTRTEIVVYAYLEKWRNKTTSVQRWLNGDLNCAA
jgi:hypothetical protein